MLRIPVSSLISIALFACSSPEQNSGPSLVKGGPSSLARPLSGRCTTVITRVAPPPIEIQRIEYTCHISHLGLTHAVVIQTVDVATGDLSSTGEYVSANGDRLRSSFSGSAVLSFTDPTDASVTFQGTQRFSGGTGRFAEVDGSANLAGTAHVDLVTGAGVGEFTLEGTLT